MLRALDPAPPTGPRRPAISPARLTELVVFVVALAARLGVILRKGGIHGIIGYDCGVYFAGADALIHGRLPYRDFTMLHPPAITLVLAPFALLTRWTSDWHAFLVATFAFCLIGAVNAVLVVVLARRLGLGALASGVAGLFYAVWYGSISGEFEVKLEPLGNLFLLCGMLLLLRAQRTSTRRDTILAGLVLGLTLTVKIWWCVPVGLLVVWHAWRRRSVGSGGALALGAAVSALLVCGPFFVADPGGMFASVVTDQLGRGRDISPGSRIDAMTTLPELPGHLSPTTRAWLAVPIVLVAVAVLYRAWRASTLARIAVVLVLCELLVLFAAPSWFEYYSDYLAVGLALCVGAGAAALPGSRRHRLLRGPALLLTATMLVITTAVTVSGSAAIRPYAGAAALTRAIRDVPCVMTNYTTVLIRLDALTRGLADGCPNWIDVDGRTYGPDKAPGPRSTNRKWHRALLRYLRSGDAIVLSNPARSGITGELAAIKRGGVLARAGGHVVYRVRHRPPAHG